MYPLGDQQHNKLQRGQGLGLIGPVIRSLVTLREQFQESGGEWETDFER